MRPHALVGRRVSRQGLAASALLRATGPLALRVPDRRNLRGTSLGEIMGAESSKVSETVNSYIQGCLSKIFSVQNRNLMCDLFHRSA
jgi:hypothetical protein